MSLSLVVLVALGGAERPAPQEYARQIKQAKSHLTAERWFDALESTGLAVEAAERGKLEPELVDPVAGIWVAAEKRVKTHERTPGKASGRCNFLPRALTAHRELSQGNWSEAEVELQALNSGAKACGVGPKDPRRARLLDYRAWVRFAQGDAAGAFELLDQATQLRARSLVNDDVATALVLLMQSTRLKLSPAEQIRRQKRAQEMLASYHLAAPVVRVLSK